MPKQKKSGSSEEKKEIQTEEKTEEKSEPSPPSLEEGKSEEEKKEEEEKYKGRFSQFSAKDIEDYKNQLEQAYASSQTEGQRLNEELKKKEEIWGELQTLVKGDPELKQKLGEQIFGEKEEYYEEDETDVRKIIASELDKRLPKAIKEAPEIQNLEQDKRAQDETAFIKFLEEHSELKTDEKLQRNMEAIITGLGQIYAKEKKAVNFETLLQEAWNMIHQGEETKETAKTVQKEQAAQSSGSSEPKKSGKTLVLTEGQKEMARNLGLTEENYIEGQKLASSK